MGKKGLLVLIIAAFVAGGVFAQNSFSSMAKNTITVDVGPTIVGFGIGPAIDLLGVAEGFKVSGIGGAVQYERQLSKPLSVAVRGAYLGATASQALNQNVGVAVNAKTDIDLTSFSGEGHVRFYPLGDTFFLDGMVGYAQLNASFSGKINVEGYGEDSVSSSPTQNYLKLGAKVGWRISFGKNGGFTFEPALGYSHGIGLGDSIESQLKKDLNGREPDIKGVLNLIENYIFIGGPRVSLAFGYRF